MKLRYIFITSAAIFTLLFCFIRLSEARSFCSSDKIFNGPLCNEWLKDFSHSSINSFWNKLQDDDDEDLTSSYHQLIGFHHLDEISGIHEKRGVFTKWMLCTGPLQRPPPLYSLDHMFNTDR